MALTLVTSYKTEINVADQTSLVSSSFTPATGELLVVKAANADADQLFNTPTVSGFTTSIWTSRVNVGTSGSSCRTQIWTASVTSGGTAGTVTVSIGSVANQLHSMVVERWTGWQLAATPATVGVAGDTTSPWQEDISTAAAGSVVSYVASDWSGSNPSGVSFSGDTATPTQEQTATYTAGNYTTYWLTQDAASAGANTIGLSAPSGINLTTAAIEIQAAGGGAADSGPNYAGTAADMGGGSGSWTNPTNAQGAADTTYAVWTSP